jgi:hypothetical protein
MNVTVELLRWTKDSEPEVLQTLTHICHSLDTVAASAQGVIDATELPANGYRIITDAGFEFYGWHDRRH